jgi:hypothetical protein
MRVDGFGGAGRTAMDKETRTLVFRGGAILLAIAMVHFYWFSDASRLIGNNVFVSFSVFFFLGAVLFSDTFADAEMAAFGRVIGYAGLLGHGIYAFVL